MTNGDRVTLVFLHPCYVEGYGGYRQGDVAGFPQILAEALVRQDRVRRYPESPQATPAPSASAVPVEEPRPVAAEPTTSTYFERPLLEHGCGTPSLGLNLRRR